MGADVMTSVNLPPLPPGFEIEGQGGMPPLPEGFELEQGPEVPQHRPLIDYSQDRTATSRKLDTNPWKTAVDQTLQGATFNTADDILDPILAAVLHYKTGMGMKNAYKMARETSQRDLDRQLEASPEIALPANLVGGLVTGGAAASTKAGKALASSIGRGVLPNATHWAGRGINTASKVLAGAGTGAASGAAYGAGGATEGNRLEGAERGAILGGAFGAAIPAAGAALKGTGTVFKGVVARDADKLAAQAASGKAAAGSIRDKMAKIGAVIGPQKSQVLAQNIDNALKDVDIIPELMPKTAAVVRLIKEGAGKGGLELNKLDQYRRLLRAAGNEDSVVAGAVRRAIDDGVNSLADGDFTRGGKEAVRYLNAFRKEYSQAARFDDVADVLIKAGGDANKIKSGLTRFLNDADNIRGWSDEEIKALRQAANSTIPEHLYKGLGRFGFTPKNVFMPFVGGGLTTFGAGGPAAVGLVGAGTASRGVQTALARGKAETLLRTIEKGGARASKQASKVPYAGITTPGNFAGMLPEKPPLRVEITPEDVRQTQGGVTQTDLGGGSNNDRLEAQYNPEARAVLEDAGFIKPIQHKVQGKPDIRTSEGGSNRLPVDLMVKIAMAESSGNPNARAKGKGQTALGLFQFTKGTWEDVRKAHPHLKLRSSDRANPEKQALAMAEELKKYRREIMPVLKREPTDGELYVRHFAGRGGSSRLFRAKPNQIAARVLPSAAEKNEKIFYEDSGRARTVREVIQVLSDKVK